MAATLPARGAHELLEAVYEHDPHAVRGTLLVAFQAAGGDYERAADELEITVAVLRQWVERIGLERLIAARWPREKESK